MVSITLDRLWMVSDWFSVFRQISQVQTFNIPQLSQSMLVLHQKSS